LKIDLSLGLTTNSYGLGKTRTNVTLLERGIDFDEHTAATTFVSTMAPSNLYYYNNEKGKNKFDIFRDSVESTKVATLLPSTTKTILQSATRPPSSRVGEEIGEESFETAKNMNDSYNEIEKNIKDMVEYPFDHLTQIRQPYDRQRTGYSDLTRASTSVSDHEKSLIQTSSFLDELLRDKSNIFRDKGNTGRIRSSGRK
jgi:hypothetical protein